jgi:hypothetical protein
MAGIDLSAWVGKPPPRSKDPDDALKDAGQSEGETSSGRKSYSKSPDPESVSSKDVSASPTEGSKTHSKPDSLSPPRQTLPTNGFYIDIPAISDKEQYGHLPGYFTVHKILREVTPARYLVKLRSGEVDLVSLPS